MRRRLLLTAGTAALTLGGIGALLAQYPGRIETQKKAQTSSLRSIAVLEWTGDRSRPNATRLVPVSLFDGNHLQDGALYLARPVPLALDSGTEYEVENAGVPQGWFDITGARQIGSDWFGFGSWKPYVPPAPKKLRPSKYPPTVVRDKPGDEDRPHFVRRDQSAAGGSAGAGGGGTAAQGKPGQGKPAQDKSAAPSAPVDPDRPRLRRRPDEDKPAEQAASPAETPSAIADADRPHMSHGKPADLKDEPKPLEVTPVALGQTVAVSDADKAGAQTFAFEWGSPADAASAQKELEKQAAALLASTPGGAKPAGAASPSKPPAAAAPAKRVGSSSARTRARRAAAKATAPAASPLNDVRFGAYALTYGSGATLVLTARETGSTRSIAVIGIEDIYGKVQVLWHSITDDEHLDVTPRVTLVDAVDPRGDGRANLLFEQRNTTDRRFVLYAVGANTAQQVFATDPLPLHPVAQASSE
jgi:hypothetical protein